MTFMRTAAAMAVTAMVAVSGTNAALANDLGIEEFRIGLLGGENASDRLRSNECLRDRT